MSKRSAFLLIEDMQEAARKVTRYTGDYDFDRFLADERTCDAVVRNFEIIGEAAARLPLDLRESYPRIEWSKIIGLRNRIVHEYFGVDLAIVWNIIKNDLAQFETSLESIKRDIQG